MKLKLFVFGIISLLSFDSLYSYVITGKVIDQYYFPVANITVSIAGGGSVKTGSEGNFQVSTEKMPYDLFLTDISNNTVVLFRSINITEPELTLFGDYPPRNVNSEAVKIEFPPVLRDHSAIIKFISNDLFYSEEVNAFANEKSKIITVNWSQNTNSISGKIIYLEKTSSTYNKFAEKTCTVLKDFSPQIVKFDSVSSYTVPGDSYLTVFLPTVDYATGGFIISADFLSMNRNSRIDLNKTEGDIISSKCLVPLSIPYGFRLKVTGYAYASDNSGFSSSIYTSPNSSYNILTETPPMLSAPQDKFWGVSNSTEFGYEWGSGSGVYVIHYHCFNPVGDFYMVTKEKFVNSPFNYAGNVLTGDEFSWRVYKYLTYITIDEFVRPTKFSNDVGYKAVLQSEQRTFRKKAY